ncbi:MAG TPA: DUF1080 domain-containing protein [Gemmatales bacterium]|nr:DUF1080 domain-containing protein [Gemmatales bacterium]HMP59673.1 DUF1080 domain-containing protein [Gemmatales bacterium]
MRFFGLLVPLLIVSLAAGQAPPAAAPYGDISAVKLLRPDDGEDHPSEPPPPGAIVLFDGTSLDGWVRLDGSPPNWKLLPGGIMQVGPGSLRTERTDWPLRYHLHVEFRVPYMPKHSGQWRGNSGVFLYNRYEFQILDSYGRAEPRKDDCGALYGVAAPRVNASKAPTVWQAFDIEFTAPTYAEGKRTRPARFTVKHNGVLIHDDVELDADSSRNDPSRWPRVPGGIMLQDHSAVVQFRNLWLLPRCE